MQKPQSSAGNGQPGPSRTLSAAYSLMTDGGKLLGIAEELIEDSAKG